MSCDNVAYALRLAARERLSRGEAANIADACRTFLAKEDLKRCHPRPTAFAFDPTRTLRYAIGALLDAATKEGKTPEVAYHLVGATLNASYPTAVEAGRSTTDSAETESHCRLLVAYNQRVDAMEADTSLRIEIPQNLISLVARETVASE